MSSVSTKPASGFRDFVGAKARQRSDLIQKISKVYESFGFEPLDTPALENLDVLLGSGGQDNEKLIFKTLKRGEKLKGAVSSLPVDESKLSDLGLRFDLTVPLCRCVAQYRNDIQLPWKVYHMGPVWRAERPQKGRFREFIQCDVDIIGSKDWGAEVEILQSVVQAFAALGVSDLSLHLNHREIINELAQHFGFGDQVEDFAITLDKADKLSIDDLMSQFKELSGSAKFEELALFLKTKKLPDISDPKLIEAQSSIEGIKKVLESLNLPLKSIEIDASLVRGMGYYTGAVFELRHASAGYSLAGGGRYDHLIGRFSKQEIPSVGMSIGFERLLLLLEEKGAHHEESRPVFMPVFEPGERAATLKLAASLRSQGVSVDVFSSESKLKTQMKYAADRGYRWVVLVGSAEREAGEAKLKDLTSGEEISVRLDGLASKLL